MTLKKLAALQEARLDEMQRSSTRLKERPRSEITLNITTLRMEELKEVWRDVRATHAEIVIRDDIADSPYVTNNVYATLQTLYEDTMDFLLKLKSELEPPPTPPPLPFNPNDSSVTNSELRAAKLPKLDLRTFSGKSEDWENFCDLFTTLVDNVPNMADAAKLQYLKSCLKGPAAELVKDVSTTNANYATTWKALKERYYNPRLIVFNHLRALLAIPQLKKESATDLRAFTDEAQRIVRALSNLKLPVEHWDIWFVFILSSRLDPDSHKAWETELSAKDRRVLPGLELNPTTENILEGFPKFSELAVFLENRARALSMLTAEVQRTDNKPNNAIKPPSGVRKIYYSSQSSDCTDGKPKCPLCAGTHRLFKCYKFQAKTPNERREEVVRLRLCFNCLSPHRVNDCPSTFRCKHCEGKHHSMIHDASPESTHNTEAEGGSTVHAHTAGVLSNKQFVLLATAQLTIVGAGGARTQVRALLDQGSESSFVSSSIVKLLNLPRHTVDFALIGIGGCSAGTATSASHSSLSARNSHPSFRLVKLLKSILNDSIDVILGADVYGQLLRPGLRKLPPSRLIAQNTALGWIVSSPVDTGESWRADTESRTTQHALHCAIEDDLDISLQRFWQLEELPPLVNSLTPLEEKCENLFKDTHTRSSDGRFVVRLPLKSATPSVSEETLRTAMKSLSNLHRRFAREPGLANAYRDFMFVYEELGHMERVPTSEINSKHAWYIPHHAVVKATVPDYKIRVVFDASRKTNAGECLNDFLLPGPPLQRDLALVLLNWRRYRFVFTADIIKMFRQINVAPEDRDLQRILWAPSPTTEPVHYRLSTVTYGTACAPYLAIRTLMQLADDERSKFPLGAQCLDYNTYVDDTFAGADELSVAKDIRQELCALLATAGITLDKWAANHSDLLPPGDIVGESKTINANEPVKTLGIYWDPVQDQFKFKTLDFKDLAGASTKRAVLASISRLFDPLGWLAPITVTAKIIMQDMWISKSKWDEPLSTDLRERWTAYCNSLSTLPALTIDRWLGGLNASSIQIHGFADASQRAYAAAVYIRIDDGHGQTSVTLLAAKSKIAPVKTVSLPNLELCGATLLVKLIQHVQRLDFLRDSTIYAWSDSQIVLNWLKKHPCHWKTFVANRVSLIQTELPRAIWGHVPTKENPADLATRGCNPLELAQSNIWWHGPAWLVMSEERWPKEAPVSQVMHTQATPNEPQLLTKFSSLPRLCRIVAYCLRPLTRIRRRKMGLSPVPDFLTVPELSAARNAVIRLAQAHAFQIEIKLLREGKSLNKRSPLFDLNPILDKTSGLLLVGGRLSNSILPERQKHPPILPRLSFLSRLFVRYAHRLCLHGGPTLTANTVLQMVWIIGRNQIVKTECRNCIRCQRVKPRFAHQMMGDLPAESVTPARPFSSSGLDYAGPFQIRTTKGRGYKSYKGYVVLFVCFSTRAIHLECVSDLTAKTFVAEFRRFGGRRGIPRNLYSDNATTFQAADKELKAMFRRASDFYKTAAAMIAEDGTSWTFIPPSSPHYGGLWEAGVKSVKHHIKRVIGDRTLTFEEFTTVLVQIEACVNSRPICPLKSNIDDLRALTPNNFLLGEASALVPDMAPPDEPENRLDRYHILQAICKRFWDDWSGEYLQHLQQRNKWKEPTENFAVGQLVLVRDDRYPPAKWPLGRVLKVHPGPDGLIRVVTVKTATSVLRRHIARLCPLSIEENVKRAEEEPSTAEEEKEEQSST